MMPSACSLAKTALVTSQCIRSYTTIGRSKMRCNGSLPTSILCSFSSSDPYPHESFHQFVSVRTSVSTEKHHYWANQTPSRYSDEDIIEWVDQFPQLRKYEMPDIQKWRNAFDTYDHDNDGFISPADLQKNPNISLQKVQLLKEADRDNNNLIDFGEFVDVISKLDRVDIRRTYEGFDSVDIQLEFEKFAVQNEEGTKKVMNIPQLRRLMSYCDCICVTDKDAERLLADIDSGGDGFVDLEEFKTWLKRST